MTPINELIKVLIHARKRKGLGQGDFESMAGFKQQQISRMEKGNDMKLSNFMAWADALGYDVTLVERGKGNSNGNDHTTKHRESTNLIHQILGKSGSEEQ
ncbi:helix-turn-helix domain-containing protein [Ferrimonas lipolytica]|uniref:Helix-turn-helix transcriptional regulator n=1 Tax=Ferrimonas lipolytica TaxID=2724191 RepID=A0A6H1UGF4_9GAMM|nr:helix-turn-helix transcriptional regulator [Ferrimonas lipolytica]QIZ77709.1 helix-turn-helix transcriptional regulator [Ferrimonas lipolytica]